MRKAGERIELVKSIPADTEKGLPAYALNEDFNHCQSLAALIKQSEKTVAAIKAFHRSAPDSPDYHAMLVNLVMRHARGLDTISRLIELNRIEHALGITRMIYEAFLNFYIDWLCPQFMGPRLQFLAAIRGSGKQQKKQIEANMHLLTNFVGLLENTTEKARVSPLGSLYHEIVYPTLSLVAHQSYRHL